MNKAGQVGGRDEPRGVVLTLIGPEAGNRHNHESVTRTEIARRLADLMGYVFAGEFDPQRGYEGHRYFVPAQTLVGCEAAHELGIGGEDDLFGAVVPHAFMTVKTITHPLVEPGARAPGGWCHGFCDEVRSAVLDGFAAFDRDNARRATGRMLEHGPVRVKRATGVGGNGQSVVSELRELDRVLGEIDDMEIETLGVVLEENLTDVVTHSVGQVRVDGVTASYCGTQRLTPNNGGVHVYGGSTLLVVRGDFDELLALDLPMETRRAIDQARIYDAAAIAHFRGMFASRRNYDVAQGKNTDGHWRCGVLEQSWRLGGASGAEIGALEAFRAAPDLRVVRATSTEIFGECMPPAEAVIYFRDVDERVGMLTKYTVVERHAGA